MEANKARWYKFLVKRLGITYADPRLSAAFEDQILDFGLHPFHGDAVIQYLFDNCPAILKILEEREVVSQREADMAPNPDVNSSGNSPKITTDMIAAKVNELITFQPDGLGTMMTYTDVFTYHDKGYYCSDFPRLCSYFQGRNEFRYACESSQNRRIFLKFTMRCYDLYHSIMYKKIKQIPWKENQSVYKTPDGGYALVPCARMGTPLNPYYRIVRKVGEDGDWTLYWTASGVQRVKTVCVVSINRLFNVNKNYPFEGRQFHDIMEFIDHQFCNYINQGVWFTSWVSFRDEKTDKDIIFLAF